MKIVCCLGNPGEKYADSRHNTGFRTADRLSECYGIPIDEGKHNGICGKGMIAGEKVLLVKPLTFMNNSGQCIRAYMDFYKVEPEDVIVIYDDIDLEPGRIRVRSNGTAGSHNGMKSVVQHMGTTAFPRIRVGVGHKPDEWDLADFVLAKPSAVDAKSISEGIDDAVKAVECIIADGIDAAMNRFNRKEKPQESDKG